MNAWISIGIGATLGAWCRWQLSLLLNGPHLIAWGTLAANAIGGLLMGVVLALIHTHPQLSPAWRLFLTTGFLGGLTTFSTFSAEAYCLLQKELYLWAMMHVLLHVVLSISLTAFGYWAVLRSGIN